MTENTGLQRLFGGCGCGFEGILPIIIIGAILIVLIIAWYLIGLPLGIGGVVTI